MSGSGYGGQGSGAIGVLFVHGIGEQGCGDTLVRCGEPLHEWLSRWVGGVSDAGVATVTLADAHVFRVDGDDPSHLKLDLLDSDGRPRLGVVLAESWWADTFRPPTPAVVGAWALTFGPRVLRRYFRRFSDAADAFLEEEPPPQDAGEAAFNAWYTQTVAPWIYVAFKAFASVGMLLATTILWTLVLALVPLSLFPPARPVVRRAQLFLANTLGDSYVLLRSPVRTAGMVTRVQADIEWLRARSTTVAVVAHSQGAVIAHRALRDGPRDKVALFVTYGSALKLLHATERAQLTRLDVIENVTLPHVGTDPTELQWDDFYASADPVPGGPLWINPGPGRSSTAVDNFASVSRDHGAYWRNSEQFVAAVALRVARLGGVHLDALGENDAEVLDAAAKQRARRVAELVLARWACGVSALSAALVLGGYDRLEPLGAACARALAAPVGVLSNSAADGLRDVAHAGGAATALLGFLMTMVAVALVYQLTVARLWRWLSVRSEDAMHARSPGVGERLPRTGFAFATFLITLAAPVAAIPLAIASDESSALFLWLPPFIWVFMELATRSDYASSMAPPKPRLEDAQVGDEYALADPAQPASLLPRCAHIEVVETGVRRNPDSIAIRIEPPADALRVKVVSEAPRRRFSRPAHRAGTTIVLASMRDVWSTWQEYDRRRQRAASARR